MPSCGGYLVSGEGRPVGGFDGVCRCRKVGLAGGQADDLDALGAQIAHLAGHRGRGRHFHIPETLGDFEHGFLGQLPALLAYGEGDAAQDGRRGEQQPRGDGLGE